MVEDPARDERVGEDGDAVAALSSAPTPLPSWVKVVIAVSNS